MFESDTGGVRIRKRTLWFKPVFGQMCSYVPGDYRKLMLQTRTMRGIWGEWW